MISPAYSPMSTSSEFYFHFFDPPGNSRCDQNLLRARSVCHSFGDKRCQTSSTPQSEFLERKTPYFLGSCVTFHNTHSAAFPTTLGGKKQIPGPQIVYLHFGSPWFETVSNGPRWLYQDQLRCGEMPWVIGKMFGRPQYWNFSNDCDWIQNALKEKKQGLKVLQTNFKCIFQKGAGRWSNRTWSTHMEITGGLETTASRGSSTVVVSLISYIYLWSQKPPNINIHVVYKGYLHARFVVHDIDI